MIKRIENCLEVIQHYIIIYSIVYLSKYKICKLQLVQIKIVFISAGG